MYTYIEAFDVIPVVAAVIPVILLSNSQLSFIDFVIAILALHVKYFKKKKTFK